MNMDNQLYREEILDLWRNPANYGRISKPDIKARELNPLCGDEIRLEIKLGDKDKKKEAIIKEVKFSGNGCAISQASASRLTQLIYGKRLSQAKKISSQDMLSSLGIHPGPTRLKCATLSLVVLKKAIENYEKKIAG